jgi:hypothetical protein
VNNQNHFVKAFYNLRQNCAPDKKRVFTLKTCQHDKQTLLQQGKHTFYFNDRTRRAIGLISIGHFMDNITSLYQSKNPQDGRPTFYGFRRRGIKRMASKGVAARESMPAARHKRLDVHAVYAEFNDSTREQRIRAQFDTG